MRHIFNSKSKRSSNNLVLSPSRLGVFMAAGCLTAATGYMNVSTWVDQGATTAQKFTNGAISTSLELFGVSLLAWAAVLLVKERPLRAMLASVAAAGAVYFNTSASQGYFENQEAAHRNVIEQSLAAVEDTDVRIGRIETQIEDIRARYDGALPRTKEELEAAYSWLTDGLEDNPVNRAKHDSELVARTQYEALATEIDMLRADAREDRVAADDEVRPVIAPDQRLTFIWFLEALKAGAFFLLGTSKLNKSKRTRSAAPALKALTGKSDGKVVPAPANGSAALAEPIQTLDRRQWAIIRAKQRRRGGPRR